MLLKRIKAFLEYKSLSYNRFEKSIEASRGTISRALKHNKTIGSNVVESILRNYPELSAEWLLRGKGEMLSISDSVVSDFNENTVFSSDRMMAVLSFYDRLEKSEIVDKLDSIIKQYNESSSNSKENIDPLEHYIISTWDKKYGFALKNIKRQLDIYFRERLNQSQMKDGKNEDKYVV